MPLGQVCQAHARLHILNIISDPAKLPQVLFGVKQGISCAWVSIARLSYRARVNDGAGSQYHLGVMLGDGQTRRARVLAQVVDNRQMGMAYETKWGLKIRKILRDRARIQQIFPDWLAWAAVDD